MNLNDIACVEELENVQIVTKFNIESNNQTAVTGNGSQEQGDAPISQPQWVASVRDLGKRSSRMNENCFKWHLSQKNEN